MSSSSLPLQVLVIDDDEMSREVLALLLAGEGYRVSTAASGADALRLLRTRDALPDVVLPDVVLPDVVLTDLQMPGISGERLAGALRAACGPATTLLAISASAPPEDAVQSFDGFLMKPFSMGEFAGAIRGVGRDANASVGGHADGPDAPDVLDEEIFRQLGQSMTDDQMQQLYAMCVRDSRMRIARMRALSGEEDEHRFTGEAHAVKGAAGMLGARQIYALAAELEAGGRERMRASAQGVNTLDELDDACNRLESMLGSRRES